MLAVTPDWTWAGTNRKSQAQPLPPRIIPLMTLRAVSNAMLSSAFVLDVATAMPAPRQAAVNRVSGLTSPIG
jgi:hypothetical protein